jgi:hypothetical protein
MRRITTALALLVCLTACSNYDPRPDDAMAHMAGDVYYDPCPVTVWVTGVIVGKGMGPVSTAIQEDNGVVHGLVWGGTNTARVEYGKRYKIGGAWFGLTGGTLWACGGASAVIPQ